MFSNCFGINFLEILEEKFETCPVIPTQQNKPFNFIEGLFYFITLKKKFFEIQHVLVMHPA